MGNFNDLPQSISEDDDYMERYLEKDSKTHRRSRSFGNDLGEKRSSRNSSFLSYVVKESSFATLSVDEDGNKTVNNYIMISKIGYGSYGKALKEINKSILKQKLNEKNALELAKKEVAILKKLKHKNIVRLIEVIDDPNNDKLFIVMEYVENSQVWNHGDPPFPEGTAKKYLWDIINGLEYLHTNNVIHRDIKPENLLLDHNNTVKLSDFGVSEFVKDNDDSLSQYAGTPAFQSPEAIQGGKFSGKAADIWALGVTLYLFIYGKLPFNGETHKEIFEEIEKKELTYPNINDHLKDLFIKIFERDPKKRIKVSEIKNHPWLNELNQNFLYQEIEKDLIREIKVDDEDILKDDEKKGKPKPRRRTIGNISQAPPVTIKESQRKFVAPQIKEQDKIKEIEFQNQAVVLTDENENEIMDLWQFLEQSKPTTKETHRNSKEWPSLFKLITNPFGGSSKNAEGKESNLIKFKEVKSESHHERRDSSHSVQPSPMNSLMKKDESFSKIIVQPSPVNNLIKKDESSKIINVQPSPMNNTMKKDESFSKIEKSPSFKKLEKVETISTLNNSKLEKKDTKYITTPPNITKKKDDEENEDEVMDWLDFLKGDTGSTKKKDSKSSNSSNSPRREPSPKGSPKGGSPLWGTITKVHGDGSLSPNSKLFVKVENSKTSLPTTPSSKFNIPKKSILSPRYEQIDGNLTPEDSPKSEGEISVPKTNVKKMRDLNNL